jgi:hypothetical protein
VKITIINKKILVPEHQNINLRKLQEAYIAMNTGLHIIDISTSSVLKFEEFAILSLVSQTIINNLQELSKDFPLRYAEPEFFSFIFGADGLFGRGDRLITAHATNFFEIFKQNREGFYSSFIIQWGEAHKLLKSLLESQACLPKLQYSQEVTNLNISLEKFTDIQSKISKAHSSSTSKPLMQSCISQILMMEDLIDKELDSLECISIFKMLQQSICESIVQYTRYATDEEYRDFSSTNIGMFKFQPIRNAFAHSRSLFDKVDSMSQVIIYQLADENVAKVSNKIKITSGKKLKKIANNIEENNGELVKTSTEKKRQKSKSESSKKDLQDDDQFLEQAMRDNQQKFLYKLYTHQELKIISENILELSFRYYIEFLRFLEYEVCQKDRFAIQKINSIKENLKRLGVSFEFPDPDADITLAYIDTILSHDMFNPKTQLLVIEKQHPSGNNYAAGIYNIASDYKKCAPGGVYQKVLKSGVDVINYANIYAKADIFKKAFNTGLDVKSVFSFLRDSWLNTYGMKNHASKVFLKTTVINLFWYMILQDANILDEVYGESDKLYKIESRSFDHSLAKVFRDMCDVIEVVRSKHEEGDNIFPSDINAILDICYKNEFGKSMHDIRRFDVQIDLGHESSLLPLLGLDSTSTIQGFE